jgi:gliding motility-associated-like protein
MENLYLPLSPVVKEAAKHRDTTASSAKKRKGPRFRISLKSVLIFLAILFTTHGYSQEICNNGLDDDGDGYVDQFDVDCSGMLAPSCFATAPANVFGIQLNIQGTNNEVDVAHAPTIGDIDGDGKPEIISALANNALGYRAYHVNGSSLVTVCDFVIPVASPVGGCVNQPAIADIDKDGTAEVICVNSSGFVYVFSHTGGTAAVHEFLSDAAADINFGSPRVADIDEDGVPEIIIGNDVFRFNLGAGTLTRVIHGSNSLPYGHDNPSTSWGADIVVVDIIASNPGKEIIAGSVVYAPNMGAGTLTVLKNLSTISGGVVPANADGPTAIADLDLDGDLDIAFSNGTRFYIWDPNANALLLNLPAASIAHGMPAIAYVYNDITHHGLAADYPEVIQVYANVVRAYNLHVPGNVAWSLTTADPSGETGITAFDFNGDAVQEIVYNDEQQVRIINGDVSPPVNLSTFASGTGTWMEHPVIADVDNDGQAEIVAATGTVTSFTGRINIFNPTPGNSWQPAREVWNQRGYRVVNINDNLTIPIQETNISNFMPAASTQYRVLNQYNAQFNPNNLLLEPGTVAATDAQLNNILLLNNNTGNFSLNISIVGGSDLPAGAAITLYNGNPTTTAAAVITTIYTNTLIPTGTSVTLNISSGQISSYDIYCVINDNGSAPRPFNFLTDFPTTGIAECNYANNMQHLLPPDIDTDGDGITDDVDLDLDNDGILNSAENGGLAALGDEDGDGTINCQDAVDNGTGDGSLTNYADANGNGVPDAYDNDGDGVVNMIDLDSDNDGIHDRVESGEISGADATNDGRVDGAVGTDGVPDVVQGLGQQNNGTVNYTLANTDGTDTPNFIDLDSDNDNCSDANEYYALTTADGGDGGVYGTGTPAVSPVGTVIAAAYAGSYAPAINSRPASIAIGAQPSNQTITFGSAATYTVSASATTPSLPTFQWQESTNNGSTWNNVSNGGIYSGATTATLIITTPSAGMNGYDYRVLIHQSDHICAVLTSNPANLQINFPPVANDDNGSSLTEDGANGTVNIITNDTDVDGNPTAPTNAVGQFTVDLDPGTAGVQTTFTDATGIWTYNGTTGIVTFDPANNYNGIATHTYVLCDPSALCDPAVITFTVDPVNDPPVVDHETHIINEDNTASGDLTNAGDSDPVEGTTLTANTTPLSGPAHGTITVNANGTYTYTPTANYIGTDQVVISICDAGLPLPALCVNDTIYITINPVNDPPVVDHETHIINEDNTASGDLTDAGDSDPEGTTLTANTTPLSGPAHGTITVNANGTYTYTPTANYNGTDQVVISICDAGLPLPALCVNDTIYITINPVNDPPVVDHEVHIINEDNTASGDLTDAGDSDPVEGTPLTANTTPLSGPAHGTITVNANGTYTYTPTANYNGTDQVVISICDAGLPLPALCVNDTIYITINPVNDPPVVDHETHIINEDNTASGDLTNAGDTDPEGTTLTANTTPLSGPAHGTITVNANGTYTYTPTANYNGTDQVVISICDAGLPLPALCVNDTIYITINPVNDPPVVDNETDNTPQNTPVSGDLTDAGDSDIDGNLVVTTTPLSGPTNGSITINPNGTYTYSPNIGFSGHDTVVVQICDDGTPLPVICVTDTIFINVSNVNDPPVLDNEHHVINEDNTAGGDVTDAGDSDPEGTTLTANTTPVSGPAHGTITVNANGTYTYTPNANYNGTDQVVISICDAGLPLPALCVNDTIFITINPVNDPPVIDDEFHNIPENTTATGDLTNAGDSDIDGNLIANTTPLSGPSHGTITINANGTYSYTPNANYNGNDTVIVQICDDGTPLPAICVNDTIFIVVSPFNDPPVVDNEYHIINEDSIAGGDLTNAGDSDPDGNLVVNTTPLSGPAHGTITINPNGTYTYIPNPDYNGNDRVIVQICDDGTPLPAKCVNDTIFIKINPVNDPPVLDNENHVVTVNQTASGDLTNAGDYDIDGNLISGITASSGPNHGTIVINADGTYTYTPANGYEGSDTVIVQICDDGTPLPALCRNDTIFITVNGCDSPVDSDGDGLTDCEEITGADDPGTPAHHSGTSDPNDKCDPFPCTVSIPEAFTPDGDGHNDVFMIKGAEAYPDNELIIYNRWGNVVYQVISYKNDWGGTCKTNMAVLGGTDLPTGTYYYIFDLKDRSLSDKGVFKGFIYLKR